MFQKTFDKEKHFYDHQYKFASSKTNVLNNLAEGDFSKWGLYQK